MERNEERSSRLVARMANDMEFVLQVAVADAYNAIRERYEQATGDARKLGPDRLSRRLFEMWRDGRRQEVRDIAAVPYMGGRDGDLDAAYAEARSLRQGRSTAGEVNPKGWVDDLVGIAVDLAEDGQLFGDPQQDAEERARAERREGARVTSERMLWIMAGAVALVALAVLIYRNR